MKLFYYLSIGPLAKEKDTRIISYKKSKNVIGMLITG